MNIILQIVYGAVIQVEGIICGLDIRVSNWLYVADNKADVDTTSKWGICVLTITLIMNVLSFPKCGSKIRGFYFPGYFHLVKFARKILMCTPEDMY
jgi:hypothetical protein